MQAIILAAGMGRRLGELTSNNTKCMVKVNGVALIDRLLGQLTKLNLDRVILVIGYKGENLKEHIGDRYDGALNIEYIENAIYDQTNNIYSLALAKNELQDDDTLLIESDLIFDDNLFNLIVKDPHPNIALVAKYQTWMDGTMVQIDDDNNIINFVPKKAFDYNDISTYYKTVNIYKFSKDFSKNKYVPFLEAYSKSLGNNEYYEQVLRVITFLDQSELKALPIGDEKWYEIDDIQDLDIAETIFAGKEDQTKKYFARYGGYWRFPQVLDFCYLVNPFFPTQRMIAEIQANFATLLTEYPSGLSVNSLLASKCFGINKEYIVPGNGAAELIKSLMELISGKLGVIYPTFEEYPNRHQNALEIFTPNNPNFSYNATDVISHFDNKDISALLIINPDNPSGNMISKEEMLNLCKWSAKKNITLIVDESFIDFSENYKANTLLSTDILEQHPNLILIKSISKSFGVPGLRLGILATANKEILDYIKKDIAIWNINSFAEFYMQIYNKYEADYNKTCNKFCTERGRFYNELSSIPYLRVIPSQANYFLCEVTAKYTATELTGDLLSAYNILIKDCSTKKGFNRKNYIRIAIRSIEDNCKLISVLKQL